MPHANSLGDMASGVRERGESDTQTARNNSFTSLHSMQDASYSPDLCHVVTDLSLTKDLSFLRAFVREGDLQSAVTISLVLWNSLKNDEAAKSEIQTWLECFFDLLSREECYEELVRMREICSIVGMPKDEHYVRTKKLREG